mmetsp:Transcript_13231/g.38393  ORF Transcript_13231/g.38393 Transcript_13231/m.38393 type:complete len:201 (-) Transcript_13231:894-1496(-)
MMMAMMMMMMMNRYMFGYFPPLLLLFPGSGSGSPSSRRTSTTTFSSPRKISISRTSPTVFRFKSRNRSALCFMGIRIDPDLTPVMMSPRISRPYSSRSVPLMPALSAGLPGLALMTSTPSIPSISTLMSGANWIPIRGLRTRPLVRICWTEFLTVSMLMANPTPPDMPVLEYIAVLIPITRPSDDSSGPPEFPGLMEQSV